MINLRKYPKKLLWRLYFICLVVSLILDFYWLHKHIFHYHFSFQYIPQFFAILGFAGCILLIIIAKGLGIFIVVDEDYFHQMAEKKQEDLVD
ncbi:MAG: hypothetical protein GY707_13565 [Desulfobacteraceae bacterium]|nr:hypothetical protein [Desulfobacteraceae bacterium]